MRYFTEIVLIIIKVAVGQVIIIDFRRIFNRAIAFLQLLMIGLDWQSLDLFPLYLDNNDGNDCQQDSCNQRDNYKQDIIKLRFFIFLGINDSGSRRSRYFVRETDYFCLNAYDRDSYI